MGYYDDIIQETHQEMR